MADLNVWPIAYRMQFVRSNVTEAARDWFLYKKFTDWGDFVKQFRATFVPKMLVSDCWDALKNRKQGRDEPIMKYFQEKVRWCSKLSLGFSETRDYVIRGLYKWELAQYALGREHKDTIKIAVVFVHTHRVYNAEAYRDTHRVSEEVRENFITYFNGEMTPAAAKTYHEVQITSSMDNADNMECIKQLANAQINPTDRQIYQLFETWRLVKIKYLLFLFL
ncbi:hypothetical protein QTP88_010732 [Uroleucon formosanum]